MSDESMLQCYVCLLCGYVYDPELGDPTQDIDANTPFKDVPDDWVCPLCYVEKTEFEPMI